MLDFSHLPSSTNADVQVFNAGSYIWNRPRGVSMVAILAIGSGGYGGAGFADATGAGGGGGASGAQTFLCAPALNLPSTLFVRPGTEGLATHVYIPTTSFGASSRLLTASQGSSGTDAGAGSSGNGGTTSAAATASTMHIGGGHIFSAFATQAGIAGDSGGGASPLVLPVTGLVVTGGTGGGALPGGAGGSFTVAGAFPPHSGGLGGSSATTPGGHGSNGYDNVIPGLRYSYGGTGGGSSHGSATGAGLFGGNGGNGGIGCGGGGGGGCLTGGVAGVGGRGGPGQIIIIAW